MGNIIKYDAITDGVITGVTPYVVNSTYDSDITGDVEVGAIRGIEGKYIYIDGVAAADRVELTSDTKYLYVDTNASGEDIGVASGEVILAESNGLAATWRDNVVVVVDANDKATLLVVDVKNDYTCTENTTLDIASPTLTSTAGLTLTLSAGIADDDDVAKVGDSVTLTIKNETGGDVSGKTITLANAKFLDTGATTKASFAIADGATVTFTIIVTADNFGATTD